MPDPVDEVIAAEREAERMLQKAEERKLEAIAAAKRDALALLAQRQKQADAEQEAAVRRKAEELARKKEKIRVEGQAKVAQLERAAQGGMAKAKDFVLKEFEERLG
jgi:vacuolar-type H+-ATPase subunit H